MADQGEPNRLQGPAVMLAFRAENARSFAGSVELSLLGSRVSEEGVPRKVPWREGGEELDVLPAAGIFGSNASGKSNLLRIMHDMKRTVLDSFKAGSPGDQIATWPFRLASDNEGTATTYEVDLVVGGVLHEYGFTLDEKRIRKEWAFRWPKGRQRLIFRRDGNEVELPAGQRVSARPALALLRSNALLLSTAAAAGHDLLSPIYEWFQRNLVFAEFKTRSQRQAKTMELLEDDGLRRQVLSLLRDADLGITDVRKRDLDPEVHEGLKRAARSLQDGEPTIELHFDEYEVRLAHKAGEGEVELRPAEESEGTLVWFGLIGPVVEALRDGTVLLADELDASLHPALVRVLVSLFQSQESNPRRAQLIFNSHDVTVMGDSAESPLGRDQVWFTQKDLDGATHAFPLTDFAPRKNEAVRRRYLEGRYGATPIISPPQLRKIAEPVGPPPD